MKSYTIHYDRTLLLGKGIINLLLLVIIFISMGFLPLNPIGVFMMLTLCWFTGKWGGRAIYRFIKHKPLCVLREKEIEIAMPSGDGKIMEVKDMEDVEIKEEAHRIRMVVHGKNIHHPSGVYLVDMHHPFTHEQFHQDKAYLYKWLYKHQIQIRMAVCEKKEVNVSV